MSETSSSRLILHLVIEGLAPERRKELEQAASAPGTTTEIFPLTETNGREALEKIFSADSVQVWGKLLGEA